MSKKDKESLPPWRFSTSSIVEAILSLISKNPKQDRYLMNTKKSDKEIIGRKVLVDDIDYPLRKLYIAENDLAIFDVLKFTLDAIDKIFWVKVDDDNFIKKTVGIASVFKFLKSVLLKDGVSLDTMKNKFPQYLKKIKENEDFSDSEEFPSSTKGLTKAYKKMMELTGL
ncbi:hypothetical protein ACLKMH_12975 [Psychromonas sp. KJ10-10]|uniref:hypothetical protein n=1 Tax=Psychromonas sp. KJ10-10 TaxID=3391823 RepID=UPI0039B48563